MIHRVEVVTKPKFIDAQGQALLSRIKDLGIDKLTKVTVVKIYKLEGIDDVQIVDDIARRLLHESIWQNYAVDQPVLAKADKEIEIALKPGVMDTEIASIMQGVSDLGISGLKMVGTGTKYIFFGKVDEAQLDQITTLLMNPIIQTRLLEPEKTLLIASQTPLTETIAIRQMSDQDLEHLSKDRLWLNLEEMQVIRDHFQKLQRDPTDLELEMLAQTWSEHCGHKTFKAKLKINGQDKKPLMTRIQEATAKINSADVISVFEDNSGAIKLFDDWAVCGKVETHNSPSAIEPYGGAMTGSGGVFRDIVGTGQGAKVVASTDIFCLAPYDLEKSQVPKGCIPPRRIGQELVRGVKDYGNQIGIPTNNGSLHFHPDFVAKPSVIVGAYGIMPVKYAKKGQAEPGDLIVTIGGQTGRDGIHGATFSSGEMTADTKQISGGAVQIGNAIEEKRMFDAILVARDQDLIRAITDCGAGGYSSAVGEMAEQTGAKVELDKVPLKYKGLAPWEMWLSESQERMVLAIGPENIDKFNKICQDFNVEATVLGEFTNDQKLQINFKGQLVGDLEMSFIHDGLPQREMSGTWQEPNWPEVNVSEPKDYNQILLDVLNHWNVCSREPIVRRYDHEVQGSSVLKPYGGLKQDAPNDAGVIEPILGTKHGLAIAHGLNPIFMRLHPYWGAVSAFDECVRNLVSSGANPDKIALLDNFVWPFPEGEELGQLDQAVDACYDVTTAWKMPLVSGKDSLSSTYRGENGQVIKIPPVLCVSGFVPIDDISKTISSSFKQADNDIFLVGQTKDELGGSVYLDLQGELGNTFPKTDIKQARLIFSAIYKAIQAGLIKSCHDLSEGGLAAALAEMCFGNELGAEIDLEQASDLDRADKILFSESNTRFLIEVTPANKDSFQKIFSGLPLQKIGQVSDQSKLVIKHLDKQLVSTSLNKLKLVYQQRLNKYY